MALVNKTFSDIITFTRASTATFFNSAGVLTSAANDAPRFDYDPATLAARGLLIEESRTNSIRNNTMVGAVAGTPGTIPTNWAIAGSGLGTLTQTVVGTGTSNGITYIDVKFSGTTSTTGFNIAFETATQIAALSGQTWTQSAFFALVGGSITNINNLRFQTEGRDSGGATVESFVGSDAKSTLTSSLQRLSFSATLASASTAYVRPVFSVNFASGVAIDITLRIGLPQLELGAFATSVIPTTTTALTRAVDLASVNTLSPWFNASASTVYFEGTVATVSDSQTPYFWSISDSTKAFGAREQIAYTRNVSSVQTVGVAASGGVTSAAVASPNTAVAANTVFKAAASYAANDVKLCVNGLTPATTASATLPTGLNTLKLGAPGWSLAPVINAFYMRRLTYYPRSFSGVELQTLTA
jgi:hypothetical protein